MPVGSAPARSLLDRRLVVVTGKGGVGKTAVAAACAGWLASRGARTLALDLDQRESLHRWFDVAPSGGEWRPAGAGLQLAHLDAEQAVERLVRERVGSARIAGRLTASAAWKQVVAGAPGLRELAILAQVERWLEGEGRTVDVIVLDAPATGHAASWLETPIRLGESIRGGPVGELADRLADRLVDRRWTSLVLVTLLEELPVSESRELLERLRECPGIIPGLCVANRVVSSPAELPERQDEADPLAAHWRARWREQETQRLRLPSTDRTPWVELPDLPLGSGPRLRLELQARLAEPEGVSTAGRPR